MFVKKLSRFFLLSASFMIAPLSAAPASESVAIVLITDRGEPLNPALREFYSETIRQFYTLNLWSAANSDDLLTLLPPLATNDLTVASLDKKELRDHLRKGALQKSRRHIPTLQRALDTLALSGALIIDCDRAGSDTIKACHLSYYDRAKTRVTATATKSFAEPIASPKLWAAPLLSRLATGLKSEERDSERKRVDDFIKEKKPSTTASTATGGVLGLSVGQESMRSASSPRLGLATIGISAKIRSANAAYGIMAGAGKITQGLWDLQSYQIAADVNTFAPALDVVIWDFGLSAGFVQRTLKNTRGYDLLQQQFFIALRPGLFWELSPNLAAGLQFRYQQYFGGKTKALTIQPGERLSQETTGIGLALNYKF